MLELDFRLLLLGADIQAVSMLHYSEQKAGVPYRYWKEFNGPVLTSQGWVEKTYRMFAHDLDIDARIDLHPVQTYLEAHGLWTSIPLNYGRISCCRLVDFVAGVDRFLEGIPMEPGDESMKNIKSNMIDLINELWFLPRNLVSDGFDQALNRLAQEVPMTIHEYPSGEACWTWKIPEKWSCQAAILETLDGKRLVDAGHHPLHVAAYSLPFEGIVSRAELLQHLHVHPRLPEAIPFVFKYYDRDWGLCTSQELKTLSKKKLTGSKFRRHSSRER